MKTRFALIVALVDLQGIADMFRLFESSSDEPPAILEPPPFTRDHPKCLEVERRLAHAKMKMLARGTPLLLGDRAAWPRVSGGVVVQLRERL